MKDVVESRAVHGAEREQENERLKQIARILQVDTSTFRQANAQNFNDRPDTSDVPDQSAFNAFVSSPEGQSLISNFLNIEDQAMRERVLSLVMTLARRGG